MLIQFTVGNYLSFKDKVTLSMEATSIKENPENVFTTPDGRYRLLKSVAIYGANGSGKSNLINSIKKMKTIVDGNLKLSSTDKLGIVPFKLNTETEKQPSFFEITFLINTIKYRYGFEIDNTRILSEWLFETKKGKENSLFIREKNDIKIFSRFSEGKDLDQKTGENKLFLSVVDQFNGQIAGNIIKWISKNNQHFTALDLETKNFRAINRAFLSYEGYKFHANTLFKNLELGFNDFDVILKDNVDIMSISSSSEVPSTSIKIKHNKYDINNKFVEHVSFELDNEESKGTNKIFDCTAILLASVYSGSFLSIDELDASLHPLMTLAITKLFNSNENNPKNAQLIFTTHDTNLLSKGGFRRDQIYFVEKDKYEASHLYSLAEFKEPGGKKVRKDRSFEEDYIQGRYGAIPFIGDFSKLLSNGK